MRKILYIVTDEETGEVKVLKHQQLQRFKTTNNHDIKRVALLSQKRCITKDGVKKCKVYPK